MHLISTRALTIGFSLPSSFTLLYMKYVFSFPWFMVSTVGQPEFYIREFENITYRI